MAPRSGRGVTYYQDYSNNNERRAALGTSPSWNYNRCPHRRGHQGREGRSNHEEPGTCAGARGAARSPHHSVVYSEFVSGVALACNMDTWIVMKCVASVEPMLCCTFSCLVCPGPARHRTSRVFRKRNPICLRLVFVADVFSWDPECTAPG